MAQDRDTGTVDLKDIAPHLTCALCGEPLARPTRMCETGHTFCRFCRTEVDYCPECRGKFLEGTRNYPIEQIAAVVGHKCRNFYFGCKTLLTRDLIKKHSVTCPHSAVTCPLEQIPEVRCRWIGSLSQLLNHIKKNHTDIITSRNYFNCNSLQATHRLTIYKGELFLYYKQNTDGQWYASVQSAGLTGDIFKSVFILRSHDENSNEAIEISFAVDLITTLDKVYRSGRCLLLDDIVVKHFIKNKQMNMMVSIEDIRTM
jgi:hypothetical protein